MKKLKIEIFHFLQGFGRFKNNKYYGGNMKTLIPTFIENLLDNTLKEKPFTILASRPSVGKTSLALQICSIAMKKEKNVLIFSVEVNGKNIKERLGKQTKVLNTEFQNNYLTIDDKSAITVEEIISRIKNHLNSKEALPELIIIDYAQLLRFSTDDSTNRELLKLKKFTQAHNLTVILLSQMSNDDSLTDEQRITEMNVNPEIADYIWILDRKLQDAECQLRIFKPGNIDLKLAKLNFNEASLLFE